MPTPLSPLPYTAVTLQTLLDRLSAKLGDSGSAFWPRPELTELLNESIQTFQAWSGFYTQRVTIPLVANQTVYNLPEVVTELQYTTTASSLIQQIRRVLLEVDVSYPNYTSQLDTPEETIKHAIQLAYENFLATTQLIQQWFDIAIPAPGDGLVEFPRTKLQINHMYWRNLPATPAVPVVYTQLFNTDTDATQGYTFYATSSSTPKSFIQHTQPINYIRLYPSPSDLGKLVGWLTNNIPSGDLFANPIPIPDSLAWVLKYSALEYLFNLEGQSRDLFRAEYCNKRVEDTWQLTRNYPAVYNAWINSVGVRLITPQDLAASKPNWLAEKSTTPRLIVTAAWNQIAVYPTPDGTSQVPLNLELELQVNPPLLTLDTDYIQIPQSYHDTVINFAYHLAMLKTSGAEFMQTLPMYKDLLKSANDFNARLTAIIPQLWLFKRRSTMSNRANSMYNDQRGTEIGGEGLLNTK